MQVAGWFCSLASGQAPTPLWVLRELDWTVSELISTEELTCGSLTPSLLSQDTAGQERYRTITTAYYRGAMGFILMYDITNEESFNAVQDWSTQIKTYSWDNAQVLLVGNKCDMEDERVVSSERGRQLADHLGEYPEGLDTYRLEETLKP